MTSIEMRFNECYHKTSIVSLVVIKDKHLYSFQFAILNILLISVEIWLTVSLEFTFEVLFIAVESTSDN